jgi:hypothetical protein
LVNPRHSKGSWQNGSEDEDEFEFEDDPDGAEALPSHEKRTLAAKQTFIPAIFLVVCRFA